MSSCHCSRISFRRYAADEFTLRQSFAGSWMDSTNFIPNQGRSSPFAARNITLHRVCTISICNALLIVLYKTCEICLLHSSSTVLCWKCRVVRPCVPADLRPPIVNISFGTRFLGDHLSTRWAGVAGKRNNLRSTSSRSFEVVRGGSFQEARLLCR